MSEVPEQAEPVAEAPAEETPVSTEEQAVVETPPEVPQVDHSAKFAELKRREREVRREKNRIKNQMDAEKNKWIEDLKTNPLEKLRELGISSDVLADAMLGNNVAEETSEAATLREIEELKKWKAEQERSRVEAEQQRQVEDYRKQVFSKIEENADKYELLLQDRDGKDLYWNSIVEYYQNYVEAPTDKELTTLADKVEEHIFEKTKALLSTSKFKPSEPTPKAPEKSEELPVEESKPTSKTLSKSLTARQGPGYKVNLVQQANKVSHSSPYHQYMEARKQALLDKLK